MTAQRSTIITVIVIVAAVILVALAYSQQQIAATDVHRAETLQAVAESTQATAAANAEIAATAQAAAESDAETAIAEAEIAATKQAVAESDAVTAIAGAEIAATKQAAAKSVAATATVEFVAAATTKIAVDTSAMTALANAYYFGPDSEATKAAQNWVTVISIERATAAADYEVLAATATQAVRDITATASAGDILKTLDVGQGYGAAKGFWQVYFTAPTGSSDSSTYVGGIVAALAEAIGNVQYTLDIAAFQFDDVVLTQAVLDARARGVVVRIVTDDENGLDDKDQAFAQFIEAGILVVSDNRPDLMHDTFMILDGTTVWTGSWSYTTYHTYRNNNNALALRAPGVVQAFQAEFDEMFARGEFGPDSATGNAASFEQAGVPIQVLFPAEDSAVDAIKAALSDARRSIRFMAFTFTLDDVGQALIDEAAQGVTVQGLFETRGSTQSFSELPPLACAGLDVRQDGNKYVMNHKVFIIDDTTVITGSFNFSTSSQDSNDETLVIISDPDLAAQYIAEFERRWAKASVPDDITCN